jgi:hypothetical protein
MKVLYLKRTMISERRSSAEPFAGNHKSIFAARKPRVLSLAADEGRILVSHDFQTMPQHFRQFLRTRPSPGLLLVRQDLPVGDAIEMLLLIWEASDADEWVNRACLVPSLVTIAG